MPGRDGLVCDILLMSKEDVVQCVTLDDDARQFEEVFDVDFLPCERLFTTIHLYQRLLQ